MSETKHTAGPWSAYDDRDSTCRHEIVATGRTVARIYQTKGLDGEDAANARLIAAAPDMLEALRVAQKWLANCVPATEIDGPKPLPMVAAALAKAEGRS